MSKDDKARIADNPSAKEMTSVLPAVRLLQTLTGAARAHGMKDEKIDGLHSMAADLLDQSEILTMPDRFNAAFADEGWIATGSMAAETMQNAVRLHEAGKHDEAEEEILAWFSEDNIRLFAITRAKRFNKAHHRWDQLNEALSLTLEERYLGAVPLILIACDGFASDVLSTSPFEKDADLSVFDSIVGHTTSLPALIKLVIKGVRKSSDDELSLPMRHGILHGRSLGYANRRVCMKAWMLMIALVDWACDKESETARRQEAEEKAKVGWRDLAERSRKIGADKQAIEAFEPTETSGPFDGDLDPDSPESAIAAFLSAWKARNYGKMAERAVNLLQKPLKKMAGEMRSAAEMVELRSYEIQSVRQHSVAAARAIVTMHGKTLKGEVGGRFEILILRHTADGDIAMPTDDGRWDVQQGCIFDLMHERRIEAKQIKRD
jgi:hypothetical protein